MAQTLVRERPVKIAGADQAAREQRTRAPQPPRGISMAVKRIVLGILTMLVSVNLWTGGPLLSLWVGSRIQSAAGRLSMTAVVATIAVMSVESFLLYKILAWLTKRYNTAIGRVMPRQQAPWLKPMSGERRAIEVKRPLTAPERIVVVWVVVAALLFEVWFFFFAHYSFAS